ncbi:MAG: sialidase family protein [Bacteroidia bacterium]|nr:sialidase family protein [Bacteroidia bacterium]
MKRVSGIRYRVSGIRHQLSGARLWLFCLITLMSASLFSQEPASLTDVFINGTDGYPQYRIPALLCTQKGSLLAFCEGRASISDHAANDIVLKRSSNQGKTWLPLQVIAEDGDNCLSNPEVVQVEPTGRILLVFQIYPKGYHESLVGPGFDSDTTCRAWIIYSDDDGVTWSKRREITRQVKRPTFATSIASGPGNGIQLKFGTHKGRVIMPFNQGPVNRWKTYAAYSDDLGENWAYGEVAFEQDPGYGNEVQMVELSNGTVMLNTRIQGGHKCRKIGVSSDGGINWTGLVDEPQLPDPVCMASIIRLNSSSAKPAPIVFCNPANENDRINGVLRISFDDAKTWDVYKTVYPGSFAYSHLTDMGSNQVGLLFEREEYSKISFIKTGL